MPPSGRHGFPDSARAPRDARDDNALIDRVAHGDIPAFESLFRRYRPRLRRFLARFSRRPHVIDEILNDTMFVIWRKAGTFNARSRASTWILGIALRRSLNAIRGIDRAQQLPAFDIDDIEAPAESGPEAQAVRSELRAELVRAVESLSADHRAVVELTYFEGRSCAEVAAIVGCPVGTVKTRMMHARRRLRAQLAARAEDAA
jgi:RNA polymerase sigma factor (sigma-70 family)